jgi:rhodanese-related sulfurtransferase
MKLGNILFILAVSVALSGYSAWVLATRPPQENDVDLGRREKPNQIRLVRLAEARALWRRRSTVFLDVRPALEYRLGHIRGALSLPEEDFEKGFPRLKARLERARVIVVYCKSEDCAKSLWTAIRLRNEGLTQTRIYPHGWYEWSDHGLPAARGRP